jgi:hypothetical protein
MRQVKEWKSSIRYIDPGRSCATAREWRSSIKTVETYRGHGEQSRWKPAVRVFKLAECRTEWRMTSGRRHVKSITHEEPSWHASRGPGRPPQLKWAPPFRNAKLASHIVCKVCPISLISSLSSTSISHHPHGRGRCHRHRQESHMIIIITTTIISISIANVIIALTISTMEMLSYLF